MIFFFVSFSYRASPHQIHRVFIPIRAYYHVMRWIFGKNYNPFETSVNEGLHPLLAFLKSHQQMFRLAYYAVIYVVPTLLIAFILHILQSLHVERLYQYKNYAS